VIREANFCSSALAAWASDANGAPRAHDELERRLREAVLELLARQLGAVHRQQQLALGLRGDGDPVGRVRRACRIAPCVGCHRAQSSSMT
jgi:hypothetical protein